MKSFNQKLTKQTLKIYWQHATRYKLLMVLISFSLVAITATEVYVPFLYRRLLNLLAGTPRATLDALMQVVFIIIIFYSFEWVFRRIQEFSNSKFQSRIMSDLLNTCFKKMHGHSYAFFTGNFVGSLVRKVNRFARSFEDIADEITYRIGRTVLSVSAILIILFYRHWLLGLGFLIWTIVFVALNYWFSKYRLKYDLQRADLDTKTTGYLADTVTNSMNLKLFSTQKREYQGYKDLTEKLYEKRKFTWYLSTYFDSIQSVLLYALEIGLIILTVRLWSQGILTVGDFALIQAYIFQIVIRIWDIGRFFRQVYEALADANEMTEILEAPVEIKDAKNAHELKVTSGKIEFNKINFAYKKGNKIFNNFSLKIKPGEKVALIGPSGGGKSTIVKLLFRFFDLQNGQILIDEQNVAKATQNSLRSAMSMVPQEPILFHRSLMENIRYARPGASKQEVVEAAKKAHAHEFITSFPQGYKTFVGERGIKLSGGERQRVAIARAILKNAPILVLDEATSSLDSESEHLIQDALKNLMKNKTVIVIAHRLSTIMQMDRIMVIDKGKIVEEGRHEELLKAKQGTYQRLWQIQAGGFA